MGKWVFVMVGEERGGVGGRVGEVGGAVGRRCWEEDGKREEREM